MSGNWKADYQKKLDKERKRREEEEERKKQAQRAKEEKKEQREKEKRRREMEKWGRKYKCHICGKPSECKFERHTRIIGHEESGNYSLGGVYPKPIVPVYDYSPGSPIKHYPGDLKQCVKCGKWACEDHVYWREFAKGEYGDICKRCAGH